MPPDAVLQPPACQIVHDGLQLWHADAADVGDHKKQGLRWHHQNVSLLAFTREDGLQRDVRTPLILGRNPVQSPPLQHSDGRLHSLLEHILAM